MAKLNCWEIKKCGRQVGGDKAKELGTCIAAQETRVNGVNGGQNGGRSCFAIAGTLCGGKVQGSFASKMQNCLDCDFFKLITKEEGANRKNIKEIIALMSR